MACRSIDVHEIKTIRKHRKNVVWAEVVFDKDKLPGMQLIKK